MSAESVATCPSCGRVAEVRFLVYGTEEVADRCGSCGVQMRRHSDGQAE